MIDVNYIFNHAITKQNIVCLCLCVGVGGCGGVFVCGSMEFHLLEILINGSGLI